jgi:hypothetical protein
MFANGQFETYGLEDLSQQHQSATPVGVAHCFVAYNLVHRIQTIASCDGPTRIRLSESLVGQGDGRLVKKLW